MAPTPTAPTHVANHLRGATGVTDTWPTLRLRRHGAVVCSDHKTVQPTSGSWDYRDHTILGMEFIWHVLLESQKVWLAHAKAREGLIKAHGGLGGTMAWAKRHHGVGVAGTVAAPASGAARSPQGNLELRPPSRRPVPCYRCATHHTQRALRHPALPACITCMQDHPGRCHLVTVPSAHHITPHHTIRWAAHTRKVHVRHAKVCTGFTCMHPRMQCRTALPCKLPLGVVNQVG